MLLFLWKWWKYQFFSFYWTYFCLGKIVKFTYKVRFILRYGTDKIFASFNFEAEHYMQSLLKVHGHMHCHLLQVLNFTLGTIDFMVLDIFFWDFYTSTLSLFVIMTHPHFIVFLYFDICQWEKIIYQNSC